MGRLIIVSTIRRTIVSASALTLLASVFAAAPASATRVFCGQVLTSSAKLESDLFCPTGHGLIIEGNGIVLNLNGKTISGELDSRTVSQAGALGDNGVVGAPYVTRFAKGQFAGVQVHGTGNLVTGPGTIKRFAAGVVIEGGGRNTVTRLTVEENIGPPNTEDLGDGILVSNSDGNRIGLNIVRDNGPYDGIGLLASTERNLVHDNIVSANTTPEVCPDYDVFRFSVSGGGVRLDCGPSHAIRKPFTYWNQQNHGIKLESAFGASHFNTIQNNTVTGNGNTGIFFTTTCPELGPTFECPGDQHSDNLVRGNVSNANGFGYPAGLPALRVFESLSNGGSGITIMLGGPKPAIRSTVVGNTANDNSAHGITVLPHRPGTGHTQSVFSGNTALRNNASPFTTPPNFNAFNGYDGNAIITPGTPCNSNVWTRNNFGSTHADIGGPVPPNNLANHPCVGPVLPGPSPIAQQAAESQPTGDDAFGARQNRRTILKP